MATTVTSPATRPPGPPELLPGRPDAIVDLQTEEGVALVGGQWRYSDARVEETGFVELGSPEDPLGPGTVPNRTYDVSPHAEAADFDDSGWAALAPADTMSRLSTGRVCFNWYRIAVTLPERIGDTAVAGSTVVFEVVIDDYAEVWVNGSMPHALGDTGGPVVAGFNAPNRVVLTRDARPGDRFVIAVFGINGPISAAPANYIWMRTATLDVYEGRPERADLEVVAQGFEFTEGPVWSADGSLLFSSPNTNSIYRLDPELGRVTLFRPKSGYTGVDIGRYLQPGSNGLTFDPDGHLVMCQHGNRRILRVNPHGDTTVLADSYEGRRLKARTTWSAAPTAASGSPTRRSGGRAWPMTPTGSSTSAGCSVSHSMGRSRWSTTPSRGRTASRSLRTSARCMWGTGTSPPRSWCATSCPRPAMSSTAPSCST